VLGRKADLMKTVVVFESMYGNTHHIADEIGHGMAVISSVTVGTTRDIEPYQIAEADLFVVGGPTHIHGMMSNASRRGAIEEAEKDDTIALDASVDATALRQWIKALGKSSHGMCAAFDTRLQKSAIITGSAAKDIAKRLDRHGFTVMTDPESFFVADSTGPLLDGEAHRARLWGETLVLRCRDRRAATL
jgi:hypothetical protein